MIPAYATSTQLTVDSIFALLGQIDLTCDGEVMGSSIDPQYSHFRCDWHSTNPYQGDRYIGVAVEISIRHAGLIDDDTQMEVAAALECRGFTDVSTLVEVDDDNPQQPVRVTWDCSFLDRRVEVYLD